MIRRHSIARGVAAGSLVVIGMLFLYPVFWMITISFKSTEEIFANPYGLPRLWMFSNYPEAISAFQFARYFTNTMIYTVGTIAATLFGAGLFAYATARMKWKLKGVFMAYIQIGLVIPVNVIILSLYVLMRELALKNTFHGLVLVYAASSLPLAILILYGYFRSLPYELEESSFIDGSRVFNTYVRIILPMVTPALFSIALIVFINIWNEFPIAFITIDALDMRTIPVALASFGSLRGSEWGLLGASLVLSSIPTILLYLFVSEKIEDAFTTAGALK